MMIKVTFLPNSEQSKIPKDPIDYGYKLKPGEMIYRIINSRKSYLVPLFIVGLLLALAGCDHQGRGFALPEGDAENGKVLFSTLRCNECHSTSDIKWIGANDDLNVPLGGEVSSVVSYGTLVTSIINPTHKIAKGYEITGTSAQGDSKMMIYNEIITVQELIDIVSYLQTEYEIITPSHDYYPHYY